MADGYNLTSECGSSESRLSGYLFVFIVGNVCLGYGAVTLYNTALLLLDESTSSTDSPLYVGLYHVYSAKPPCQLKHYHLINLWVFTFWFVGSVALLIQKKKSFLDMHRQLWDLYGTGVINKLIDQYVDKLISNEIEGFKHFNT